MKVNRTESTASTYASKPTEQKTQTEPDSKTIVTTDTYEENGYPQTAEQDKNGEKMAIDAIQKANKAISISNRRFEYSIHEETKQIMVKVIDSKTNKVVREIPPEKILDMVAKMWEMNGIIVDERR